MQASYLNSVRKQFEYYKVLGEKTIAQLPEAELFGTSNKASNSIAIIVNHLWGNMMSRWTDFLDSDGEKEWRHRDMEFEDFIQTKDNLLSKWNEGWHCLFAALDSINDENFNSPIFIRNQRHTIVEAINRQLAHYCYHVGQIVFIGKQRTTEWKSLSIPKGGSKAFNAEKFARGKHDGHFTDDIK
jgi:hypothetical protein